MVQCGLCSQTRLLLRRSVRQTSHLLVRLLHKALDLRFHRGDLGVEKLFHLKGENVFQFRAESFNITNHPNFGQPGTLSPTNAAFASITGTRDSPSDARELQFALKYFFGAGGQY